MIIWTKFVLHPIVRIKQHIKSSFKMQYVFERYIKREEFYFSVYAIVVYNK